MYGRLQSKQDEYADEKKPLSDEIPESGELALDEAAAEGAGVPAKKRRQRDKKSVVEKR